MEWRALLAGLMIALILSLVLFLTNVDAPHNESAHNTQRTWYELAYLQYGEHAGKGAVLTGIRMPETNEETTGRITIYTLRPAREITILDGPWLGAKNIEKLKESVAKAARNSGLELRIRNISDFVNSARPEIILLPSGAWPRGFNHTQVSEFGGCLYYIGLGKNLSIDIENSRVVAGDGLPFTTKTAKHNKEDYFVGMNEEENIYLVNSTVDEIDDYGDFSKSFIKDALSCMRKEIVAQRTFEFAGSESYLLELEEGADTATWARIEIETTEDEIVRVWDAPLEKVEGTIEKISEDGGYRANIWARQINSEQVRYYARVFDGQYKQVWSEIIGRENFSQDINGSRRASVWSFETKMPQTRIAIIEICDQYGRIYARTFERIVEYSVQITGGAANEMRFLVLNGTEPAQEEMVRVGLNGTDRKYKVPLRDGKFSVASEWKDGTNTIEIEIGGRNLTHSWQGKPESPTEKFIRMTIGLIPVFVLVMIFVHMKKKDEYSIVFEQEPELARADFEIKKAELARLIIDPIDLKQIMEIARHKFVGEKYAFTEESVRECLDRLVAQGQLVRYDETYAPAKKMTKDQLRRTCMEMRVRDALIEGGIGVKKIADKLVDEKGRVWEIALNGETVNDGDWEAPDYLVFEDEQHMHESESALPIKKKWARRLKLAKKLSKTKFVTINNIREFSKYG